MTTKHEILKFNRNNLSLWNTYFQLTPSHGHAFKFWYFFIWKNSLTHCTLTHQSRLTSSAIEQHNISAQRRTLMQGKRHQKLVLSLP